MAKEWIEQLAQQLKERNRAAAEEFGRAQHRDGIIAAGGRIFFTSTVHSLQENVSQLRAQMQGDPASADTSVQTSGASDVRLTRSRFPWFDAHISHHDGTIGLDYARDPGTAGDLSDRKTHMFEFQVAADDTLSLRDSFGEPHRSYATPEDLARRITELLFQI